MENRIVPVVGAAVTRADGYGERAAALALLCTVPEANSKALVADKGYDTQELNAAWHKRGATPHVGSHTTHWGGSAVDGRTSRQARYAASQVGRKRIEDALRLGQGAELLPPGDVPPARVRAPAVQSLDDGKQLRAHGAIA